MRKLGDRENEDEVEKQFDEGDLRMLVRAAAAQKIGACAESHASAGIMICTIESRDATRESDRGTSTLPSAFWNRICLALACRLG